MTAPFLLVLGSKNLSSWSLRPWLALRHAGVSFEERVLLFHEHGWRDALAELSPSGRVPVLRQRRAGQEDLVVWDSLAICEHVAELHPGAGLWPEDRAVRAVARSVAAEMHSGFASLRSEHPMDVVGRRPKTSRAPETEADIARILTIWEEQRTAHAASGPFLFGQFSIADAMFAPVVFRFRTYGVAIPGDRAAAREYQAAMLELPTMKEWEEDATAEVAALSSRDTDPGPQT